MSVRWSSICRDSVARLSARSESTSDTTSHHVASPRLSSTWQDRGRIRPPTGGCMLDAFTELAGGLDHPEGIAWDPSGALFAGGEAGQIYRIDLDGPGTGVAS